MMSFYSKILVAYDGSEKSQKALDLALKLAEQDEKIEIYVLKVWDTRFLDSYSYYEIVSTEDFVESRQKDTEDLFAKVNEKLRELPNKTATIALEGNPAKSIVDYSQKIGSDLIVLGSRGLSDIKEFFIGSVSHNVVQHAQCPVLVAK